MAFLPASTKVASDCIVPFVSGFDSSVLPPFNLQVIPSITNTFGIPLMLLPLFFVVCVDAIFMVNKNKTMKYPG